MTNIYMFNASALAINVQIRSGKAFSINGTSRTTLWYPSIPITQPSWGGTNPVPGQLGFGQNPVLLNNGQNTVLISIDIPNSVLPTNSLEIYLYYSPPPKGSNQASAYWVGLIDGLPFNGVVPPTSGLPPKEM